MNFTPDLGSRAWVDGVFTTEPIGHVTRRRIKRQYRYVVNTGDGVHHWFNGTLPQHAAYLLEYFKQRSVVDRWKEYPFAWPAAAPVLAGKAPTFLAVLKDGLPVVIRVKASRYLTAEVEAEAKWEQATVQRAGMKYLLWTDVNPLHAKCRALLLRLRTAQLAPVDEIALTALVQAVTARGQMSAKTVADEGLDTTLIPAAVVRGDLHLDLGESINERTILSASPLADLRSVLLGSRFDPEGWWNSLPRPATG